MVKKTGKTKAEKRALRLKQRDTDVKSQRDAADRRQRNKTIINWLIVLAVIIGIGAIAYPFLQTHLDETKYDSFAKCITLSGAGMYGTEWCENCQSQKRMFGSSFKYITYINCDANPTACENADVTLYPTWIFGDDSTLVGSQTLETLAEETDCALTTQE